MDWSQTVFTYIAAKCAFRWGPNGSRHGDYLVILMFWHRCRPMDWSQTSHTVQPSWAFWQGCRPLNWSQPSHTMQPSGTFGRDADSRIGAKLSHTQCRHLEHLAAMQAHELEPYFTMCSAAIWNIWQGCRPINWSQTSSQSVQPSGTSGSDADPSLGAKPHHIQCSHECISIGPPMAAAPHHHPHPHPHP